MLGTPGASSAWLHATQGSNQCTAKQPWAPVARRQALLSPSRYCAGRQRAGRRGAPCSGPPRWPAGSLLASGGHLYPVPPKDSSSSGPGTSTYTTAGVGSGSEAQELVGLSGGAAARSSTDEGEEGGQEQRPSSRPTCSWLGDGSSEQANMQDSQPQGSRSPPPSAPRLVSDLTSLADLQAALQTLEEIAQQQANQGQQQPAAVHTTIDLGGRWLAGPLLPGTQHVAITQPDVTLTYGGLCLPEHSSLLITAPRTRLEGVEVRMSAASSSTGSSSTDGTAAPSSVGGSGKKDGPSGSRAGFTEKDSSQNGRPQGSGAAAGTGPRPGLHALVTVADDGSAELVRCSISGALLPSPPTSFPAPTPAHKSTAAGPSQELQEGQQPLHGLLAMDGGHAALSACSVTDLTGSGVVAHGQGAHVRTWGACAAEHCGGSGFLSQAGAMVEVDGCSAQSNLGPGMLAAGPGSRLVCSGASSVAAHNRGGGFGAVAGGVTMLTCACGAQYNQRAGFGSQGLGSWVEAQAGRCVSVSNEVGFCAEAGGVLVVAQACVAEANLVGFCATGHGSRVDVGPGAMASSNRFAGVEATKGGMVVVNDGCHLQGNYISGVTARGEGSQVKLSAVGLTVEGGVWDLEPIDGGTVDLW